jgi:hypothetical protein
MVPLALDELAEHSALPPTAKLEFFTVSSPVVLLYLPVMLVVPLGATVITQPGRMLEENEAPAFGTTRERVVPLLVVMSSQLPFVELVVTVSVPPRLSVQPLMVGGGTLAVVLSFFVSVAESVNVVHWTVIGVPLICPTNLSFEVPFRLAVTVVPGATLA